MQTLGIVLIIVVLACLILFALYRQSSKSMSVEQVKAHLDTYLKKSLKNSRQQTGLQVLVEHKGFTYSFAGGTISALNGASIAHDQPFHTASIGKVFTSLLIMKMAEQGDLSIHDPIAKYLSPSELQDLFVYQKVDYANQVTIKQLLAHTSGIADYFEDPAINSQPFMELIISKPDELWTPDKLIDFTRLYQKPAGIPGTLFHYSDTGYILLGQIIERVTGSSFSDNLHSKIFGPLHMNDSYLMFYSEPTNTPKKPIQDVWLNGVDISRFQSLSCDWAGGGIITTPKDLMIFLKTFRNGPFLSTNSLQEMESFAHKFRTGIYYGLGWMEIHFEEFFFMLKGLPRLKGHIGIVATHMLCDPETDTYIVMNFGSNTSMVRSFKALIQIVSTLKKMP
ncbi:serine hydrolase domain-containing protein [Paenibacillus eucommiae]|uniref:D-alanyl-D-alanine carboxypeptidase n=1 Tax=Paenibacillus eucommiae TaxID=1355755 RepID=A0ABS4IQW5_9BACL|nr:serine hydrolase domain-containing protein [Paenibacillus eucommiae]MBP1989386.1 D-alanyl-D-alanine carboxypeptidase [Paenibacillus eucommiae]